MATDVLDRLLITLSVRLHAFAVCEIKEGWRLLFDPMDAVTIHHVLAGTGTLQAGRGEPIPFGPDTVMIVPARVAQSLGTAGRTNNLARGDTNCRIVDDGLLTFTAGDGSRDILCICGTISASYGGALGLFDFLERPIVQSIAASEALRASFLLMRAEVARPTVGTQALTEALMKQCLILLLRGHLDGQEFGSPLLSALRDVRLARAVTAILERPAAAHTVESLAEQAGMGRSAFAERFVETFATPPIEFVQKVRLRLAAQLLGTTDVPVKVIAASVGYASRSHFSRAFRVAYGLDPTAFRTLGGFAETEPRPAERLALHS